MYEVIRKVHLYTAMILLTFVLMYFISGYVLIHRDLMPEGETDKETVRLPLSTTHVASPNDLSGYLQETLEIHGKPAPPRQLKDGRVRFDYFRPGDYSRVTVSAEGDSVVHLRELYGARQTLIGMHRMHNYGGNILYQLWVLLYDLASLSLILFGLTGVYMWYKITRRRLVGWIVLAVGYGYAAAAILFLVHAK
jgi:hypothetical protein